jgi:hypothetical protein
MPSWLLPLLAFCAIAAFIGFAFRQGTKVKPDKNNTDNWTDLVALPTAIPGQECSFRSRPQVRSGSSTALRSPKSNFRSTPESGLKSDVAGVALIRRAVVVFVRNNEVPHIATYETHQRS